MTILIVLLIISLIYLFVHGKNVDDILGLSRVALVEKKRKAFQSSLITLGIFVFVLIWGIYHYTHSELYYTSQVKIFGKVKDVTKWTSDHYTALLSTVAGSIGTIFALIGSIRNHSASEKYAQMTDDDFSRFQLEVEEKEKQSIKQAKRAKSGYKLGQFLGKIFWG